MKSYVINNINMAGFKKVITLLNYEDRLSQVLRSIKLSSDKEKNILIDTALISGINEYRFIEIRVDDTGYLDLNNYRYVNVSEDILKFANSIIKDHPTQLNNSVLTVPQKEEIKNSLYCLI